MMVLSQRKLKPDCLIQRRIDPLARRKPDPSGPGRGAPLVFNILSDDSDRRAATGGSKITGAPKMAAPQLRSDLPKFLYAQAPGR